MSRGLGRLERHILANMSWVNADGSKAPVQGQCTMMARDYFEPDDWHETGGKPTGNNMSRPYEPTPAQRKAMARAFHSFVRKYPQYALVGGKGRKTLLLYEPGDPVSTAWATAMLTERFVSFAQARRLAGIT